MKTSWAKPLEIPRLQYLPTQLDGQQRTAYAALAGVQDAWFRRYEQKGEIVLNNPVHVPGMKVWQQQQLRRVFEDYSLVMPNHTWPTT